MCILKTFPDEGSVSEVNEEGEEISEAISDDEKDGLPETEEMLSEAETGIAATVLVEEEQKNEVVEDTEQVTVVQEDAPRMKQQLLQKLVLG